MTQPADSLRSSALARAYAESFTSATGLPLTLQAPGDFEITDTPGMPDFCRTLALKRKVCQQCLRTHLALQDGGRTRTVECFAGLTSSAVPVTSAGSPIAYLHTGHAAVENEKDSAPHAAPLKNPGAQHPVQLTRRQYAGAVRLLEIYSEQIGATYVPGELGSPYPAIDRAARNIRQTVEKTWRLPSLAAEAGMHPAYFSEMFHQRMGVTLTDYIATARTQKARQLLGFSNLQVIEIAFACGFGSVSQFNRTFRKIHGTTPNEFRRQLQAAGERES